MVLFAGEFMRDKISKICSYFGAGLYKYPADNDEREEMMAEVRLRMEESRTVLETGDSVFLSTLQVARLED
eukprot:7255319-Prymnesium_polylepis.1